MWCAFDRVCTCGDDVDAEADTEVDDPIPMSGRLIGDGTFDDGRLDAVG